MIKRKAQMEPTQIFLFILAAIIAAGVLLFGYTYIQKLGKQGSEIDIQRFETALENEVKELSTDYGTVRKLALDVPSGFTEVCFVSSINVINGNVNGITERNMPIIFDSVLSKQLKNVFLYPDGKTSFYAGEIVVDSGSIPDSGFACYSKSGSQIILRLEGIGKKVKISEWS